MALVRRWVVSGMQYSRTLEAWLARQDAQRADVLSIMEARTGPLAWCILSDKNGYTP